jgi:diacylglycerol kinase (ATP)
MPSELIDNSRVTVVCNAQKSVRTARRFAETLAQHGLHANVVVTKDALEGERAAHAAIDDGTTLIVAAGGDGTVRSLLGAVTERGVPLALLPLGTSNDLALDLGIHNERDAAASVLAARARTWDLGHGTYVGAHGQIERGLFCSTAGVGVIARALGMGQTRFGHALKHLLGNGVWAPLVTASTYMTAPSLQMLRVDRASAERALTLLEISKLRTIGGYATTPDARGDSGILHAWTVSGAGFWASSRILYQALSGGLAHLQNEHVDYFSRDASQNRMGVTHPEEITVEGGAAMPVHLNGDYVGVTPATFAVTQQTFRVLGGRELAGEAVRFKSERARSLRNSIPVATNPRAARSA